MSNPIIKIVNAETGEEVERPMNAKEFAQYQADILELQQQDAAKAAEEAARKAAQAKLEALGLTVDDLAALGL